MGGHMFQDVGCRLDGLLTNLVHADCVSAVFTRHKSSARSISSRGVHALSLRSMGDQCRAHWYSNHRLWLLQHLCPLPTSMPRSTQNCKHLFRDECKTVVPSPPSTVPDPRRAPQVGTGRRAGCRGGGVALNALGRLAGISSWLCGLWIQVAGSVSRGDVPRLDQRERIALVSPMT